MSLFPEENILTKEIESWKGFSDSLKSEEDKKLFIEILDKCQKYALVINAKGTVSNRIYDCGSFTRITQNDKLVTE
jgi:hypothetical protein